MSLAKLALACGLMAVALCACGIKSKPQVGTAHVLRAPGNHARIDDPRSTSPNRLQCLRDHHLPLRLYTTSGNHLPAIQVGTVPTGPTIVFWPTDQAAESQQIEGLEQGAEEVGQALIYPHRAGNTVMSEVEDCVAEGVTD
jgi:hypothetical protein